MTFDYRHLERSLCSPKTLKSWAKMSTCNKVNNPFSGRINLKRNESLQWFGPRKTPLPQTLRVDGPNKARVFPAQDSCTLLTKTLNIWTRVRFATEYHRSRLLDEHMHSPRSSMSHFAVVGGLFSLELGRCFARTTMNISNAPYAVFSSFQPWKSWAKNCDVQQTSFSLY
jgi:hypothetical protein